MEDKRIKPFIIVLISLVISTFVLYQRLIGFGSSDSSIQHPQTNDINDQLLKEKFIKYKDIVPYFDNYMLKNPINHIPELQRLFKNIKPWPILFSDPKSTVIPWIHIPKTAGSSFKETINLIGRRTNNKRWPYRKNLFPNFRQMSSTTPGCRSNSPIGPSHCRFSEIKECLEEGFANLFPDETMFYKDYYSKFPRPETISPEMKNLSKNLSNFQPTLKSQIKTIKYLSNLRNPIVRTLSEFYYRKPKQKSINSTQHAWTTSMNEDSKISLQKWVEDQTDNNQAFNRQTRSYFPENRPNGFYSGQKMRNVSRCANSNGELDALYTKENFYIPYEESKKREVTPRTINLDQNLAVLAIKNVLNNFLYLNIYEKLDDSLAVFTVLSRIRLIECKNFTSNCDEKEYRQKLLNSTLNSPLRRKVSIFKNSLQKSRKTRRKRRKRNVHSTVESRPDRFDVEILKMIYENNQLDMIVWFYFRLKLEITLKRLTEE